MSSFKVNVKWGKETYKGLELSTEEPPEVFKAQIYTLTSVPIERQKLMVKGAVIKDEWGKIKLKNGSLLLLLGSAEALPQEPTEKTVFLEDMTESELVSAMDLSSGLVNLGNTCYMNSTVQVLKSVPELNTALQNYDSRSAQSGQLTGPITASLKELFNTMNSKTEAEINPFLLMQLFRVHNPQFAEKNEQGQFSQQDANESLLEIMRILQQHLPSQSPASSSVIDQLFGIETEIKMKCAEENVEEKESVKKEKSLQLNCFISQEVKYLITGLNSKMTEEITKHSPTLDREAVYTKKEKISRLPGYLCVQMVRFFYKKGNINAKILKDVKFPLQLDVYDLCSDELKQKLAPMRKKFEDEEERKNEEKAQLKLKSIGDANGKKNAVKAEIKIEEGDLEPYEFADDPGSNNSGLYELQGVITHQGRSSSSGHYVGWVKKNGDNWLKCDDEVVTPVHSEDVLKLSGGGDWHIAYILLYGPRRFHKPKPEVTSQSSEPVPMETNT